MVAAWRRPKHIERNKTSSNRLIKLLHLVGWFIWIVWWCTDLPTSNCFKYFSSWINVGFSKVSLLHEFSYLSFSSMVLLVALLISRLLGVRSSRDETVFVLFAAYLGWSIGPFTGSLWLARSCRINFCASHANCLNLYHMKDEDVTYCTAVTKNRPAIGRKGEGHTKNKRRIEMGRSMKILKDMVTPWISTDLCR